ncbi:VOC family protein [Kibdelosporangium persicum]|uniref:Aromatic ring-opening dioxygenase n=1 Tax=Kibdelosporangium persicum TaxID=2698649 RepID=A0ABX2F092_9PSEU|nr:VOC family protein [Kibdelosporangium persicum]NRN64426.1 Aromatic ring-opening dioxygenase [Kibdelosporangium persicum]
MSIVLNHMIIPADDKVAAAEFLARLLGLPVGEPAGPFVPLRVNDDLTLDFDDRRGSRPGHYAFLVDDKTFDALLAFLERSPGIQYGSGPMGGWDRSSNHLGGGRGVYVLDPNGHGYEFFTAVPE